MVIFSHHLETCLCTQRTSRQYKINAIMMTMMMTITMTITTITIRPTMKEIKHRRTSRIKSTWPQQIYNSSLWHKIIFDQTSQRLNGLRNNAYLWSLVNVNQDTGQQPRRFDGFDRTRLSVKTTKRCIKITKKFHHQMQFSRSKCICSWALPPTGPH